MVRRFDVDFNIITASVTPREEGVMILEITGAEAACGQAVDYLAGRGIGVELLAEDIARNASRCTHCGACTSACPSGALSIDRATMEVRFDSATCLGCRFCVPACPMKAIEVSF